MPVDEAIINKSSEDVTGEDVRALLNAPPEEDRPLVEPGIFDEKQPTQPIYKSIPLKFALAGAAALVVMVPAMRFFSGNLLSGSHPTKVTSTEKSDTTETEAEEAQRLVAEENADLKRKLALQNQSFTAQEIEDAAAKESRTQTQSTSTQQVASRPPASPRPAPVSRPVAAVASRPAPVRSAPARPVTPARVRPRATSIAEESPQQSINLTEIAAAGNYGQLPSRPMPVGGAMQIVTPVVSETSTPRFVTVDNQKSSFSRAGSIPVSVRAQRLPTTSKAVSEEPVTTKRPMPMVMRDIAPLFSAVPKQVEPAPQEEISLDDADTYEAQRDLIMQKTEGVGSIDVLPSLLLPGSVAELEVTTAVTWASDLPRALGSVTLVSPLNSDGEEVIPEGTELIVQIGEMSASGAVALDVVAMVLPGNGEVAEINIPAGALEILATGGGYPVASAEQSSERQLQAIDRQQALLGAMGAAGDYLNRPESETSVFGLGGSSTSREYGSGSIWGSILSGAANEMLSSRSNRLETEADRLMARPTIWSLEPGRQLQLFVTQEVAL
ncbi:MAG: hypothetical protein AAGE59_04215 [Cyanobacteria bacterium P01_F01_bin.86]